MAHDPFALKIAASFLRVLVNEDCQHVLPLTSSMTSWTWTGIVRPSVGSGSAAPLPLTSICSSPEALRRSFRALTPSAVAALFL